MNYIKINRKEFELDSTIPYFESLSTHVSPNEQTWAFTESTDDFRTHFGIYFSHEKFHCKNGMQLALREYVNNCFFLFSLIVQVMIRSNCHIEFALIET